MRVFPWIRVVGDRDVAIWGIGQTACIGLVSIAIISHSLHEHTEFIVFFIPI